MCPSSTIVRLHTHTYCDTVVTGMVLYLFKFFISDLQITNSADRRTVHVLCVIRCGLLQLVMSLWVGDGDGSYWRDTFLHEVIFSPAECYLN